MLKLKNITKDYYIGETKTEALRGVSLAFRKSEFVSILGPSGCGKTTLLNIIGGLDRYTSGDLTISNKSTKEYKDRAAVLHLYCEVDEVAITVDEVKFNIRKALREVDSDFQDLEQLLNRDPLMVTLVKAGNFDKVKKLRISRVNPGEEVIDLITN